MKNVELKSENIKELYKSLLGVNPGLQGVMSLLEQRGKVTIQDIITDDYLIQIITSVDNLLINVYIDFLKNKICIMEPNKPYVEVYDNYPRKALVPVAYEYKKEEVVLRKINRLNEEIKEHKTYYYELSNSNNNYTIFIEDLEGFFNEEIFIKKILNSNISSIRELFYLLMNISNNKKLNLKITDTNGSLIVIDKGIINKYKEYREINNEYQKIYFENDEFYVERKIKEKYHDEMTSYIKKMGECNGKEKERS